MVAELAAALAAEQLAAPAAEQLAALAAGQEAAARAEAFVRETLDLRNHSQLFLIHHRLRAREIARASTCVLLTIKAIILRHVSRRLSRKTSSA